MNQQNLFDVCATTKPHTIAPRRDGNELAQWRDTLEAGRAWLFAKTSEKPPIREALPACETSDVADVWLLGAWNSYHGTGSIDFIHKSRGSRWIIGTTRGERMTVSVRDPHDHRDGVTIHEHR